MANPAPAAGGIHHYVPVVEAIDRPDRCVRLLTSSAILFTSAAASVVIYTAVINPSAAMSAHAFPGFVLFLIGVSLALLVPVADRLPAAARIGMAVAMALRAYLLGVN